MRRRIASWPGLLSLLAGLLILSLSAVPSLAQFSVESVTFKNNIPCTSISVPDRSPFGESEWVRNGNNFPTAYVKGTDVEVDIVIRYNGFFPFVGTLTLGGSYIPISPRVGPHTLSPTPSTIPMALPPYSTTMVTTTFSGMPDVVCSGGLFIYYDFSGMPAGPTGHSVYLVYSDPQAPMTVPWVEVLANACWWASGYSTLGDVARYLTTGLFFAQRFAYPGSGASYWTIDIGPGTFDLTRYYNTPGWVSGNCEDVSDFLTICANALGLNFHVQQYTGNPLFYDPSNNQYYFHSNPLCLIGSDPTVDLTYHPLDWVFHQIAFSSSGTVYDVCAAHKFDLSGAVFRNPPFNWPWPGEWATIGSSGQHLGIVDTPLGAGGAPNSPDPSPTLFSLNIVGSYVPAVH